MQCMQGLRLLSELRRDEGPPSCFLENQESRTGSKSNPHCLRGKATIGSTSKWWNARNASYATNVDYTEKLNQYLPKMQAYAEKMNQSQREGKNPMEEMMSKMMGGQCGQTAGAGENPMADMMSKMMSGQGQA